MFTGLVETVARVRRVTPAVRDGTQAGGGSTGVRLEVASTLASDMAVGDSIATNGVCLTVAALGQGWFAADISPETIRVTALGHLAAGSAVNLERPITAETRLGGHFVQGHVDATGTIRRIEPEGDFHRVTISYPPRLAPYFVPKGSVAVDGISLTVAALREDSFDVQIVPHTWTQTGLSEARVGNAVNLECDLIGKYVVRLAELSAAGFRRDDSRKEVPAT
jgi:riboflavin synthase